VFICDVMGHGVRSALVTAMLRTLVEELRPVASDPGELLTRMNAELMTILRHAGEVLFATSFYMVADTSTGKMSYAVAGHPPPFHLRRRAGCIEPLRNGNGGPALGIFEGIRYKTSGHVLESNDAIVLFTDGLFEVESPAREEFGYDRLRLAASRRLDEPAPALLDALLADVRAFSQNGPFDDDLCLVAMEITP